MKRTPRSRRSASRVRQALNTGGAAAGRGAQWTPQMFARAIAGQGVKAVPRKALLSLRIDVDVIEWFRQQGPGYQSRMNALLRAYMEAHQ
jgi:uncharacterized protein (DUF4415 family)